MNRIMRLDGTLIAKSETKSIKELAEASRANLGGADLYGADLYGANLGGADLRGANLRGANLRGADLRGANLGGADLWGANLGGANLYGADLRGAKNIPSLIAAQLQIVPREGAFVAWKACRHERIVKLEIPADAKRSNANGRKCRAEYVRVLETIGTDCGIGIHDESVTYRAGETVRCNEWCDDRWQECAGGIHFFLTREEAEQYAEENR